MNNLTSKNHYMVVGVIDNMLIPIHNRENKIDIFDNKEIANLDRIYYQVDHDELLKVIKL